MEYLKGKEKKELKNKKEFQNSDKVKIKMNFKIFWKFLEKRLLF